MATLRNIWSLGNQNSDLDQSGGRALVLLRGVLQPCGSGRAQPGRAGQDLGGPKLFAEFRLKGKQFGAAPQRAAHSHDPLGGRPGREAAFRSLLVGLWSAGLRGAFCEFRRVGPMIRPQFNIESSGPLRRSPWSDNSNGSL